MPDPAEIAAFRFGYGLPAPAAPTAEDLTGPDLAAARWPVHGTRDILPLIIAMREARAAGRAAAGDAAAEKAAAKAERQAIQTTKSLRARAAGAAIARALGSATPFRERMVAFWADHFTALPRNRTQYAWPSALVEEAIRPNLAGPFSALLQAVILHPGMLIALDQVSSLGPNSRRGLKQGKGLNENLARELLELHTLGVGAAYSQTDVRQMAELLTGLVFTPEKGFAFDPARVEPGAETVLGVAYDGKGTKPILRALADLSLRPETARHIATKLAVHFVADIPDPALVAALEAEWRATGGSLLAVAQVLLTHPAALDPQAQKARQPQDFIAATLRALRISPDAVAGLGDKDLYARLLDPMKAMGQSWQFAPGPDGWPEEAEAWITPQGMAARIDWALRAPEDWLFVPPEPADFARDALGSRADDTLMRALARSESRAEALALILASPAFNRR